MASTGPCRPSIYPSAYLHQKSMLLFDLLGFLKLIMGECWGSGSFKPIATREVASKDSSSPVMTVLNDIGITVLPQSVP